MEKLGVDKADHHVGGLSIWTCALFIVGEMAGGGIVALPQALSQSSWIGVVVIVLGAIASGYTGVQLGQCWTMLQKMWPEDYKKFCRKPYPEIGKRAAGGSEWMRYFVSFCVNFTLFGAACVYFVLASENIESLITRWSDSDLSFCFLLVILAACILPVTWLKSPQDFWYVSIGAMGTSLFAAIFIVTGAILDRDQSVHYETPTFLGIVRAYATITFAYGGHSAFPTLQHDMRRPQDFWKTVLIAYFGVVVVYFPSSVAGFVAYGDSLGGDVSQSISTSWAKVGVQILITLHVMLSVLVLMNVLNQELEELLGIPHHFNWKRLLTRTVVMACVLFIAETVPHFGILLNLIGGSTITLMTFVFPGMFYLLLRYQQNRAYKHLDLQYKEIQIWEYPLNFAIIVIGILAGVASTYATIKDMIDGTDFSVPCYVNKTAAE